MLFYFILIYLPFHHALSPFTYEFYDVIHGDQNFRDMYVHEANTTDDEDTDDEPVEKHELFPPFNIIPTSQHQDLLDFHEISKKLTNITRRSSWGKFYGYEDPEDYIYGKFGKMEPKKKMMMIKTNIQFLIHTRYKVYAALEQRQEFRNDKRYKLGYLFNRLRRLVYEMRKVISAASLQNSFDMRFRSMTSLMRLYEQVVRFDVDIRDTSDFIRAIYNTPDPADLVFIPQEPKKP